MTSQKIDWRVQIRFLILSIGWCGIVFSMSAALPPAPPQGNGNGNEPTLSELAIARYQVATKGFDLAMSGHQPNDAPGMEVIDWMRRRIKARLEIVEPKNDRVAFLKEYVELLKREEAFEERMVKSHLHGVQSLLVAQYDRLDGEILLKQVEVK